MRLSTCNSEMMSFLLSNRKTTEGQLVGGVEREEEQEEEVTSR